MENGEGGTLPGRSSVTDTWSFNWEYSVTQTVEELEHEESEILRLFI